MMKRPHLSRRQEKLEAAPWVDSAGEAAHMERSKKLQRFLHRLASDPRELEHKEREMEDELCSVVAWSEQIL